VGEKHKASRTRKPSDAGARTGDSHLDNAELWERCWSNARVYLGLTSEDFFRLTPRQYHLLMARYRDRREHEEFRLELIAGIISHTVATFAGKTLKDGASLHYQNFMPTFRKQMEEERRQASAMQFHCFLQGLVKEKELTQ
jgi:hypothetical protein